MAPALHHQRAVFLPLGLSKVVNFDEGKWQSSSPTSLLFTFHADRMTEMSAASEYESFAKFDRKRYPKVKIVGPYAASPTLLYWAAVVLFRCVANAVVKDSRREASVKDSWREASVKDSWG